MRSFNTVSLSRLYTITPALSVRGSLINLFNRQAPVDAFASGSTGNGVGSGGVHHDPSLHRTAGSGAI